MATRIGALFVDLALNTAKFIDGLDKSRTKSAAFGVAVGTIMADVAKSFANMTKEALLALPRLTEASIDLADNLFDLSQKTGISTEQLSGLSLIAEQSGTSLEGVANGLKFLGKNLVDAAKGGKETSAAFASIGVQTRGANGSIRSTSDVLQDVSDRFKVMPDGAAKSTLALKLFGRAGSDLIPLLNAGGDAIGKAEEKLRALGAVIDKETAKAADDFNDSLGELKKGLLGVGLDIAKFVLPPLTTLATKFIEGLAAAREFFGLDAKKLGEELETVAAATDRIFQNLHSFRGAFGIEGITDEERTKRAAAELGKLNKAIIDLHKQPRFVELLPANISEDFHDVQTFFHQLKRVQAEFVRDTAQIRLINTEQLDKDLAEAKRAMDTGFQADLFAGVAESAKITAPEIKKLTEVTNEYATAISSGLERAMQKWEGFGKLVVGVLNDIAATILRNAVTAPLSKWLGEVLNFLPSVAGAAAGATVSTAIAPEHMQIGSFPAFASGGIVTKPTFAMVGEVPEAIIPLSKMRHMGQGGGGPVNQFFIDARGAQPGVEQTIERVLQRVIPGIVRATVGAVEDRRARST